MPEKVVVIYSGGMDSFTLLNQVHRSGKEVYALSFNYGQRHSKELEFASRVCEQLKIAHQVVDIRAINSLIGGSSLTDNIDVPEGHYEDLSMQQTVVPNRNMILLSLATGYAVSLKASKVYYGAHGGDHAIYPDCRPEFVEKMNQVCAIANYDPVEICTPYLHLDKGEILRKGLAIKLNYGDSWTCYNGRQHACGKCGACQERLEAFEANQHTDPLSYEC